MAVLERVLSDQWTEAMATAWGGLWQVYAVSRASRLRSPQAGRSVHLVALSQNQCPIFYINRKCGPVFMSFLDPQNRVLIWSFRLG